MPVDSFLSESELYAIPWLGDCWHVDTNTLRIVNRQMVGYVAAHDDIHGNHRPLAVPQFLR
jgi:hypothetical protein